MSEWIKRDNCNSLKDVFLRNIGASSTDEINAWFKKHYSDDYRLDRSDEFISLIMQYKNKPVYIVGDYDVDGITSTSILLLGLKDAGFTNLRYRIPKRFSEGFGINKTIIDEFASKSDPTESLIITCDNGVAQNEAITYAKDKGYKVIIIDHHLPEAAGIIPPADIVIDPNAIDNSADFNGYCGAGLCYKLMRRLGCSNEQVLKGLAAIGTVADVMPLRQENYVIVRKGLELLNSGIATDGMNILMDKYGLKGHMTAKDIGFKIGPALNSMSRLNDDGAKYVVSMIIGSVELINKYKLCENIINTNDKRKELKEEALDKAHRIIKLTFVDLSKEYPLVLYIPGIHEGIVGIIAGDLAKEYKMPAIVLTNTKKMLKGSARSYGDYDIKAHLDKVSDHLLEYGGHTGAAGLSVDLRKFDDFKQALLSVSQRTDTDTGDTTEYDLDIPAEEVGAYIRELDKYEPFGEGNNAPVFKVNDFTLNADRYGLYVRFLSSDGHIAKLTSDSCDAISFNTADKLRDVDKPLTCCLLGNLRKNIYNNTVTNQIEFFDIAI